MKNAKPAHRHKLKIEMLPLSDLTPWAKNPRDNDRAAERLAYTIAEHGWTNPILLDRSGQIVAGHTRFKAAMKLGLSEVPTIRLDVDGSNAAAIAIADNRLGEIAEWKDEGLAELLQELDSEGLNIDAVGYTVDELTKILGLSADSIDDDFLDMDDDLVYRLVVECSDEGAQADLMSELEEKGYKCQPLIS